MDGCERDRERDREERYVCGTADEMKCYCQRDMEGRERCRWKVTGGILVLLLLLGNGGDWRGRDITTGGGKGREKAVGKL